MSCEFMLIQGQGEIIIISEEKIIMKQLTLKEAVVKFGTESHKKIYKKNIV